MAKRVIKNFAFLSFVQITNYLLPFTTIPYIVRLIGPEKYGLLAFAQVFVSFFNIFIDFGITVYGVRLVSASRNNINLIRKSFWNIIYFQILILLIFLTLFLIIIFSIQKFRNNIEVYLYTFGAIWGNVFLSLWFYQSLEKMEFITLFNFISKIAYIFAIFKFVRSIQDFILIPLIASTIQVIVGIISIGVIILAFKVKFSPPNIYILNEIFKETSYLFASRIFTITFNRIPPLILGIFCGELYVGYYNAAEKLYNAWFSIQSQITHALYPYISYLKEIKSKDIVLNFVAKSFIIVLIISLFGCVSIMLASSFLIKIIFGDAFINSIPALRLFAVLIVIVGINYTFVSSILFPFKMNKEYLISVIPSGFLSVIASLLLIPYFKHEGAVLSILLSELLNGILMFYFIKSSAFNFFNRINGELMFELKTKIFFLCKKLLKITLL